MLQQTRSTFFTILLIASALACGGCINMAANMIHAITGNNRPADFDGLKEKRVAVVCLTDGGLAADANAAMLTNYIHAGFNSNIKKIDVVRASEVERWIDSHSGDGADYLEIGKGVKADRVVAVEVVNLSVKNGATLYQGKSDIAVTVYDIPGGGKILYQKNIPEFVFPKMGGPTITDVTEAKFRARYLAIVARTVATLFYPVDATADFALDATSLSF